MLDLTGQKFGRYTVIKEAPKKHFQKGQSHRMWLCKCDCGNEKIVDQCNLRAGVSISCGCYAAELASKRSRLYLTGKRFGKLTATSCAGSKNNKALWHCVCDCGNEVTKTTGQLTSGHTKSCGCLAIESRRKPFGQSTKKTVLYQYKRNAKTRNLDWDLTKEQFYNLTHGDCFYCGSKPTQVRKSESNNGDFVYNGIDRLDNTKGYSVSNCVTCCQKCNRAKDTMGFKEFISWVDTLAARFESYRPPTKERLIAKRLEA